MPSMLISDLPHLGGSTPWYQKPAGGTGMADEENKNKD